MELAGEPQGRAKRGGEMIFYDGKVYPTDSKVSPSK